MVESQRLLLGVDGGGTSTVAWLASPDGTVLGRGKSGPSNVKAVGAEASRGALERAIAAAFDDAGLEPVPVASACLGVAGFGRPEDQSLLSAWSRELNWSERLSLVTDGDLVVAAGTPRGFGLGVIAGTGSIVVGRAEDGRTARAGGWGHLIGDEGSAYAVALAALRLVVRRADGRDPKPRGDDPLTRRLCRALGATSPAGIVSALYAPSFDRTRIAALAAEVVSAADEEPGLNESLLGPAGAALAEQASAVARALGWSSGDVPLALGGGFLLSARAVEASLLKHLGEAGYRASPTLVPEPVQGAIVLAGRLLTSTAP